MFKNYLIVAFRNLLRNRIYALLNVLGLSLGIACSILIYWFVRHQTSYDAHHTKIDRVYQVTTEFHFDGNSYSRGVPAPMWKAMRTEFPQLTSTICIGSWGKLISIQDPTTKTTKKFKERGQKLAYTQPEYFQLFDYQWKRGNASALAKPQSVVLTQKIAEKYFGKADPIGQIFRLENALDLTVAGIVEDIPENTAFPFEIFVSFATLEANKDFDYGGSGLDHWGGVNSSTYCLTLLPEHVTVGQMEKLMQGLTKKYHGADYKSYAHPLVPFRSLRHSEIYYGPMPYKWIWVMGIIGIFLIITACINFVNMATAQALRRSKEVGVRKVIGGTRMQVFWQFMAETALITFASLGVGLLIAAWLLPNLNDWLDSEAAWPSAVHWQDPALWQFLVGLLFVVVLLAGSYPGLILAGFKPVQALKGRITSQQVGGMSVRRVLVVTQFILTQLLIICTIVVNNQVDFMRTQSVGYDTKAIVNFNIPTPEKINQTTFRSQLMTIPGVQNASMCLFVPTTNSSNTSNLRYDTRQKDELWQINTKNADKYYIETFGLQLVAGKNIPESDTIRGYLVNEKFVEKVGAKNPNEVIGKTLRVWGVDAPIYGVIKNWNNNSFQSGIDPVAIFTYKNIHYNCAAKLSAANLSTTLKAIEKLWNQYFPNYLYEQEFLDESIAQNNEQENVMLIVIRVFSALAIFIACLGLYGLVSFMASQKTKEIGVRKVLGASVGSILGLFGKEFIRLISVAFVIAAPLGWWLCNLWLEDYTYRISIGPIEIVAAILVTILIAGLTVSYETLRAAIANPVNALKSE
ncbi:MAG: FtsX-like permease family protein [Spirosomataceae bacterium]